MATSKKKTAPKIAKKGGKKATKAPSAPKAASAVSAGCPDKVQIIANLMARPEGASMEEMVAAIQIEPHPMRAKIKLVRDRLGYTTTRPSKENGYRYFAQPPQSAG